MSPIAIVRDGVASVTSSSMRSGSPSAVESRCMPDVSLDESHNLPQRSKLFEVFLVDAEIKFVLDRHQHARVVERIQPELQQWRILVTEVQFVRPACVPDNLDNLISNGWHMCYSPFSSGYPLWHIESSASSEPSRLQSRNDRI